MPKTIRTYWNPLEQPHNGAWQAIAGLEGVAEQLTLSRDAETGEYKRLSRFKPGKDTTTFGGKRHLYPEEVFIVSSRLYDAALEMWLERLNSSGLRTPFARASSMRGTNQPRLQHSLRLVPENIGSNTHSKSLRF